jgi:DNA replication and repair protein RecF
LSDIGPLIQEHYLSLSSGKERVDVRYQTEALEANFSDYFKSLRQKDLVTKTSNAGIHKDEVDLNIDSYPLRKVGSQGQQKSFLIALKLAQFHYFEKAKGEKPLLLLDDIFDKLDDERIAKLLEMVAKGSFGQLFLTDARPERSREFLKSLGKEVRFFTLHEGQVLA